MNKLTYTFVTGLSQLIQNRYIPSEVSRYVYEFYLDHWIEDKKLEYVVNYLKGMDAGPEFELSKEELVSFINENLGNF